jgi:predicted negative regulator of RcsB-dependent stress response
MTDSRNTILAVILSGLVLLGWQYFFNIPQMEKQRAAQLAQQAQTTPPVQNAGHATGCAARAIGQHACECSGGLGRSRQP